MNTNHLMNLVLAILFFFTTTAHAETNDDIKQLIERARQSDLFGVNLVWKPTLRDTLDKRVSWSHGKPFCSDGRVGFFWNSTHPGGDRNGALNEENRGLYFECPLSSYAGGYVKTMFKTGGIFNSQFGDTFLVGLGVRAVTPEFYIVTLGIGGELHYIRYEHPRRDRIIAGFLPIATVDLSVRIPGWCRYTLIQHHLADTGVKLYGKQVICERRFS